MEISTLNEKETLEEVLELYSVKILKYVATLIENETRERVLEREGRPIMGGLHDIIHHDLNKKELIEAIVSYVKAWNVVDLEDIKEIIADEHRKYDKITNKIKEMSHDELVESAIKYEAKLREQTGTFLLGGLEDYAASLTKEELVDKVQELAEQYEDKNYQIFRKIILN
eukprot:TRINITY_DN84043_c0_g1_i1.p1 TRINITY_DN84043_c0_g1~~TRINITY_DN84043_c0_g1_i1.p1  ORF type:complete len:170 (+),score=20.71 TRINITY_DN84043_c0_g1_i1:280-789(+)